MLLYLTAFNLIKLCCDNDRLISLIQDPLIHHFIIRRWIMTDIDQKEYGSQLFRAMKITLDQLSPLCLLLLGNLCITVSRKVHQIHFFVDIVKVDGLCFPGVAEILA